jgi:GPI-anchor transamidase subunit K
MKCVLLFVAVVLARNYAILMNSSKGFSNYRHMTNVYVFYSILKHNGFTDDEIIVCCHENQMEDCRNIDKSAVHLDRDVSISYTFIRPSSLAFELFLNALEGNNSKLKDADDSSNVLVYLCGHGNESFLKFGLGKYITRDDLMCRILRLSARVAKILLIADTCQAEALFDRNALPDNVFAVSTSTYGEPSISTHSSTTLATSMVDNFAYVFHGKTSGNFDKRIALRDFFTAFDKSDVCSTVTPTQSDGFTYDEFFVQKPDDEILPFKTA